MPSAAALVLMAEIALRSRSTKDARIAPRLIASKPSAPEPANISSTLKPSNDMRLFSTLKRLSRARSVVGRVAVPLGVIIVRVLNRPEIILIFQLQLSQIQKQ